VLIETLRIKIARLRRQRFGKSSEKLAGEIEQLQLALEDLEIDTAALLDAGDHDDDKPAETRPAGQGKRGGHRKLDLPDDAPCEEIVLDPGETCEPLVGCGVPTAPQSVVASCGWSGRMSRRSSTSSLPSSRSPGPHA